MDDKSLAIIRKGWTTMRILVIEDNAELARQIKSTLQHALYVVDVALDAMSGLTSQPNFNSIAAYMAFLNNPRDELFAV